MSYKSENWHDKLKQVREHVQEVATVAIDEGKSMSLDQIKKKYKRELAKLKGSFPKDRSPLQMALLRHAYDHGLIKTDDPDHADQVLDGLLDDMDEGVVKEVEEVKEEKISVEKTVEKLTEKNMLGRLAKQLRLNEQGKQQMFDYFENGSLKQ